MTESITITVEAEDRLTPILGRVDNLLASLGVTISRTARIFGVQNEAVEKVADSLLALGSIVRTVVYAKEIMAAASALVSSAQVVQTATTAATQAALAGYGATATAVTAVNYGLAASFRAVFAAMGPIGWILLGLSAAAGGLAGFALAGGFQPQQPSRPIAIGSEQLTREIERRAQAQAVESAAVRQQEARQVNIEQRFNINVEQLSTDMDIERMVRRTGELWAKEVKKYLG